jgi:hypothetical protein
VKRLGVFFGGIVLGVALALLIGWVLFPIVRYDESPASLRKDYRDEYIRLTALTYRTDGDLASAEKRLSALDSAAPVQPLVELTTRWINEERSQVLITPLVLLARDLNALTPAMAPYME